MAKTRGQGEGSISKRSDGTWWGRITVGYDDNGKQKRKAFYGKTRKEVQEKLTAALNEYNQGVYVDATKMTLAEWADIWLNEYKRNSVGMGTYQNYYYIIRNHINPMLGKIKLKELRPDIIQKAFNTMLQSNSAATAKRVLFIIKYMLNQAVKNDLIPKSPADSVVLPKTRDAKNIRVLTLEEQAKFLEVIRKDDLWPIAMFALATGMRIGEILALKWDDINFEEKRVYVCKSVSRRIKHLGDGRRSLESAFNPDKTKTRAGNRVIPLLPDVIKMLEEHKETQQKIKLQRRNLFQDKNLVFCKNTGDYLDGSKVSTRMKFIAQGAGIENLHPHCLRHTFATRGLENGIELKVMQELLGHASISMTADTYTHVLPDKKDESIMKLADTIKL